MRLRPSRHANEQMRDRHVTLDQVNEAVDSPGWTTPNTGGRPGTKYFKHFGARLLCVVLTPAQGTSSTDEYRIVTVIWKGEDDD